MRRTHLPTDEQLAKKRTGFSTARNHLLVLGTRSAY